MADYATQLREIRAEHDSHFDEIDRGSKKIRLGTCTLQELTGYWHRWEEMRQWNFGKKSRSQRFLGDARDDFNDGMREKMDKGLSGRQNHQAFEERRAVYETLNIVAYKKMRILEKIADETTTFEIFLNQKIRWIEELRRELRKRDDDFRFDSVKNYEG